MANHTASSINTAAGRWGLPSCDMQTTTGNVQVISKRIKGMLANLKATLGYRAKTSFVCTSCQSKGNVAARVKCMRCGQEYWCD